MEKELFFSGYCRCLDGHRMVEVVVSDGEVAQVDCNYDGCPHGASCEIAKNIRQWKE